ncbi:hypothetical protein [Pararhodonellum marinum]|uniref:hypothetical protein n=1 Tax=Pararhodonellum marinum TaxID=2755358 RepID=UPI00189098BD|nr:hypothetical protein [Pararhodonellum marinum]
MTNIRFRKANLSIKHIGPQRFWIGLSSGVFSAISISLFFNHSREVLRYFTSLTADLLILTESEHQFYNFFFSFLSSVLGLSITLWIWMSNSSHNSRKYYIRKQLSKTNSLLIFWITLLVVARYGSVLHLVLYSSPGYDDHLNLIENFWIIFLLFPWMVFLQSWSTVRLVYRSGKWMFFSFLV